MFLLYLMRDKEKKVLYDDKCLHHLPGLNDPPTSQSSQSKPKLDEISNQWSSLQVL